MKERLLRIRDFIVLRSKWIFPVLLIAVVAVTVSLALGARENDNSMSDVVEAAPASLLEAGSESAAETDINVTEKVPDVPLEKDASQEVNSLIFTYYDALANGNDETIAGISNMIDDMERIKIRELGNYIEWYPVVEIYTKPGPEENSYVVFAYTKAKFNGFDEQVSGFQTFYVCADENGVLYLNEGEIPQEDIDYIYEINFQEDVVELYNKATVEYNETMVANTELFEYIATMESDIRTATGLIIADQVASNVSENAGDGESAANTEDPTDGQQDQSTESQENAGPVYATATATVNVRKSDSETADRLGKITSGTRVKVLEQRQNGWSKVEYEGKEAYVKSEYLQLAESASGAQVIGKVTATTGINIRATASQSGERLGVLARGESLDLIEIVDGWCKVIYNDQIAYVNADYVKQQ